MKENLTPEENLPKSAVEDHIKNPVRENSEIKNKVKKATVIGAALLATSTAELNPPQEEWQEIKDRAKTELANEGITTDQRRAYKPGISQLAHRSIPPLAFTPSTPDGYRRIAKVMFKNLFRGRDSTKNEIGWMQGAENKGEEDALRLYLGLPQEFNTFGISDYKPTRSKENKYYYKINDFKKEFTKANLGGPNFVESVVKMLDKDGVSAPDMGLIGSQIMGQFQWSKGMDEKGSYIAYYDIFNYDVPIEEKGFIGKPFEIYDRIYYDPATFKVIEH